MQGANVEKVNPIKQDYHMHSKEMCSELKVESFCFISLKTDHLSLTLVQTKK